MIAHRLPQNPRRVHTGRRSEINTGDRKRPTPSSPVHVPHHASQRRTILSHCLFLLLNCFLLFPLQRRPKFMTTLRACTTRRSYLSSWRNLLWPRPSLLLSRYLPQVFLPPRPQVFLPPRPQVFLFPCKTSTCWVPAPRRPLSALRKIRSRRLSLRRRKHARRRWKRLCVRDLCLRRGRKLTPITQSLQLRLQSLLLLLIPLPSPLPLLLLRLKMFPTRSKPRSPRWIARNTESLRTLRTPRQLHPVANKA
jgi:hypothetical protein